MPKGNNLIPCQAGFVYAIFNFCGSLYICLARRRTKEQLGWYSALQKNTAAWNQVGVVKPGAKLRCIMDAMPGNVRNSVKDRFPNLCLFNREQPYIRITRFIDLRTDRQLKLVNISTYADYPLRHMPIYGVLACTSFLTPPP